MRKNNIKVVIRTRPTANFAHNQIFVNQDENSITINLSSSNNDGHSNKKDSWKFRFHQILHLSGQDTSYESMAKNVVTACISEGINGTIMAYGQTGAGKTFTMIGDTRNYQYRGLAPRAIAHIFQEVENRLDITFSIKVSYMEIYNDRIFDLLENSGNHQKQEFTIVDEGKYGTDVRGLRKLDIHSEKDALDQLFKGELQRTTAAHKLNKRSNRSHCIFTIHISQRSRTSGNERVMHSKLHLVDLAGSERLKKTLVEDADEDSTIRKESMYINQSLTYLEQCIIALGSKEHRHIPYRQTKLTNVLKDSLGGNCNTIMFACIWGESKYLEETISTLRLAQRMMRVQNEASITVDTDPNILLKKYEKMVKDLKQELIMYDALAERSSVVYEEHSSDQKIELMQRARQYIDASSDDEDILELTSLRNIREMCRQFKILVRNAESRIIHNPSSVSITQNGLSEGTNNDENGTRSKTPNKDDQVGEHEDAGGFCLGVAPDEAHPLTVDLAVKHNRIRPLSNSLGMTQKSKLKETSSSDELYQSKANVYPMKEPRRVDRYEAFKIGIGKELDRLLKKEKCHLKEIRMKMKAATSSLNDYKSEIDALRAKIEERKKIHRVDSEVVGEEEFILLKREREYKKAYRNGFEELKETKADLDFVTRAIDTLKARLLTEFEEWFCSAVQDDQLDDGEKFEKLEIDRILDHSPDSLAFFQAQKKMRQVASSQSALNKQKQRQKRRV